MSLPTKETLRLWTWRLAIITAILVGLLSWQNGIKLNQTLIRAGLSFGLIYFLVQGSISLFESNERPRDIRRDLGSRLDIAVGDNFGQPDEHDGMVPGQVEASLASGRLDEERQAEIGQRMGWK